MEEGQFQVDDSFEDFLVHKDKQPETVAKKSGEAKENTAEQAAKVTQSSVPQAKEQARPASMETEAVAMTKSGPSRTAVPLSASGKTKEIEPEVGGRVALRQTAPAVGKGGLGARKGIDLRASAPAARNDYSLAIGASMQVLEGMEGTVVQRAVKLPDDQIRYTVGGEDVLVVGGTAGIGLAIAKKLASYGAFVTVVGRRAITEPKITCIQSDLSLVKQQRALADKIQNPDTLSILVFTTGIVAPPKRADNGEGVELDMAVSYLSRRVILERLLERGLSPKCRVFVMGYCGFHSDKMLHLDDFNSERAYKASRAHIHTVIANDALVLGMRKRHPNLLIWGLNPGFVRTDIRSNAFRVKAFGKVVDGIIGTHALSTQEYALVVLHVLANPQLSSGVFAWSNRNRPISPSDFLADQSNVDKIWTLTDQLIAKASQ